MKRDEKGRFTTSKQEIKTNEEKVYATGFKGFEKGMICRGKQYAENTVFEETKAELSERGMHFCEFPLNVFEYYSPSNNHEFANVDALAPCVTTGDKSCTTKLRINAKISLAGLCSAAVEFVLSKIDKKKKQEVMSAATNTGYMSAATNTGDYSAATNTGYRSAATVEGKESFAIATGIQSRVKGALGCFIACAEWKQYENGEWHPVAFVSAKVDGKNIKTDTWYTVKNGKFVEVE